jgi:hypothetical protein
MMALGNPAVPPMPRPVREKTEITHFDKGGNTLRTEEQVKAFIRKIRTGEG